MKSIEIIQVRKTLEDYINSLKLPKELIRMILKEAYEKAEKSAYEEAMNELKEDDNAARK